MDLHSVAYIKVLKLAGWFFLTREIFHYSGPIRSDTTNFLHANAMRMVMEYELALKKKIGE